MNQEPDQSGPAQQKGVVYTETVVHAPPVQYAADAPYQLAIVDLESGRRLTVRILTERAADRVSIGDPVEFVEERDGVSYFRRAGATAEVPVTEMPQPLV